MAKSATRAVIYARYSSSSQREESIEDQLRECQAYADANKLRVTGQYCDYAISGRTDDRPQFQRMIADAEKGLFDAVILYKTDRFARNRYDAAIYKRQLKKQGVTLHYAKMSIPDSPEGIILEALMEGMDEYYSANLAQNIRRGQHGSALKGKALTPAPIGLRINADHEYEPDPLTAPHVLHAYEMIDSGRTQKDVIAYLNAVGVHTAKGNPLTRTSIAPMWRNRKYIGEYSYGDVTIPDKIPAIVPVDLFQRVQQRIALNVHTKGGTARAMSDYILTGKLYCGHCGQPMVGVSGTSSTGTIHRYYSCAARKRKSGTCDKLPERKTDLEVEIVRAVCRHILSPEVLGGLIDRVVAVAERERQDDPVGASLVAERKTIDTSISNIIRAMEQGIFTSSTKGRLEELEAQRADVSARIATHEAERPHITRDHVERFLRSLCGADASSEDDRRAIIETLVHSVIVSDAPTTPDDPEHRCTVKIACNLTDRPVVSFDLRAADVRPQAGMLHHTGAGRTHILLYAGVVVFAATIKIPRD